MNKLEEMRKHIEKIKASKFPIKLHALEKVGTYEKNLYFKMLCVFVNDCEEISPDKIAYLNRLIAGTGAELTLPEYMKLSFDATTDDYDELINNVFSNVEIKGNSNDSNNEEFEPLLENILISSDISANSNNGNSEFLANYLRYFFVLDFLILTYLGEVSDEQLKLVAEISESVGLEIEQFVFLTGICKKIIKNENSSLNANLFKFAYEIETPLINFEFIDYNDLKVETEGSVCIFGEHILNAGDVNFNEHSFTEITFYNCTFEGDITFYAGNKILNYENCVFENCSVARNYILSIYNSSRISKCSFINCKANNQIVWLGNISTINMCEFYECIASNGVYLYGESKQNDNSHKDCTFSSGFSNR